MNLLSILKKLLLGFLLLCCAICLGIYLSGHSYIFNAVKNTYLKGYTTAQIDDYDAFSYRIIGANAPESWKLHKDYNKKALSDKLIQQNKQYETAAFMVVREGELLHESYGESYGAKSHLNSFSMAKSVLSMLLMISIEDGYIKSLDQKIIDFIPEFKDDSFGSKVSIGDLSRMSSGYDWSEKYHSPLNPTTDAYYGDNLEDLILKRSFKHQPGEKFEYLSGTTQILAIVLKRALKNQTISQYLEDKLWTPLGMENTAFWAIDKKDGIEKAFCCIYSNVRDFSKLGQLLLQKGQWKGKQLISLENVEKMTNPALSPAYGYSMWTDHKYKTNFFMMRGHLGQYLIIIPEYQLVISRLGKKRNNAPFEFEEEDLGKPMHPKDVYIYIEEALKLIEN